MEVLAISGSVRAASTNRLLLDHLRRLAPAEMDISLFEGIGGLPIFNPDLEGRRTPDSVIAFCRRIDEADGVLIACPEYVRAIPGGLKNAIDWLVSRHEIIGKPIALAHASWRGDDMLDSLRKVLSTVSDGFTEEVFLRIAMNATSASGVEAILADDDRRLLAVDFLADFRTFIEARLAAAGDERRAT